MALLLRVYRETATMTALASNASTRLHSTKLPFDHHTIAILIRGINEAYIRATGNNFNQPLRALIHSYVCVQVSHTMLVCVCLHLTPYQYNALLDLAATGNTYSSAWHGPPQGFTTWGQMAALDVTVSAIQSA